MFKPSNLSSIVLTFIAFLALSISCVKIEPPINPEPTPVPPTEDEAPAKFVPYETLHVEVPDSTYRVVYLGATKVATCYHTCDVIVPKLGAVTKADAEGYTIVDVRCIPNAEVNSENTMQMVVAFEDTKTGDHDYNDLIIQARVHVINKTDGSCKAELDIVPIAYGAAKKIGLGIGLVGPNNTYAERELYSDCRTQLFNSNETFINTGREGRTKYQPVSMDLSTSLNGQVTAVTWFINVDGTKLYASNTFKLCVDDADMPQGLVLIDLRTDEYYYTKGETQYFCGNEFWQYPYESVNISKVYPDFENAFIARGNFSVLANPTGKDYYNAIMDEDGEIDPSVCLYDVFDNTPTMEGVQLWEGGPLWAKCNLGASAPEEFGLYYTWGNLTGYAFQKTTLDVSVTAPYWNETPGGALTGSFESGDVTYDAARYTLGGQWRIPTNTEILDLCNNTVQEITELNGVKGTKFYKVTSKVGKKINWVIDENTWIFIPQAGLIHDKTCKAYCTEEASGQGYCWSCTYEDSDHSRVLNAGSTATSPKTYARNDALNIRAVCNVE